MFPLDLLTHAEISPEVQSPMIWLRYALLLLIVPAYFIALSRRRWANLPLWLVSASVAMVQIAMTSPLNMPLAFGVTASPFLWAAETTKIMLIPIAVQFAILLKARESRGGNREENASGICLQVPMPVSSER
jgi:hypothetical protein